MAGVLEELQATVAGVAEVVGGSVVGIGPGRGPGSGVIVGEGLVLTNAHNVRGEEVTVVFGDDRRETGHLAGIDADGDLAVIRVETDGSPAIAWEPESVGPAVGTVVVALAKPGGMGLRVTLGQVSAVSRSFQGPRGRLVRGSVEHTAPMVSGSSGGPIVDAEGRFLGINTHRLGEGFYAAIPANAELKDRVDALSRGESPTRRTLGVGLLPGRAARHLRRSVGLPEREGLLVREVQEGSPAARAGVRRGDLIVEANGRQVDGRGVHQLHEVLDGLGEDESLTLGIVRGVEELSLSVTFGATVEEGSA
ncbi:MAG: S1C family serine protease [Actinomycetota bacterium]|nr:S1C family serine protease [Actinomycetota bacterium]